MSVWIQTSKSHETQASFDKNKSGSKSTNCPFDVTASFCTSKQFFVAVFTAVLLVCDIVNISRAENMLLGQSCTRDAANKRIIVAQ